jgi:phosphatidate cytidylyltransferase
MIGVFVIIWTNDTGAYLIGSMIGKNKLAEKISPNKTWEGAIGGAVFAILFAILYFHFTNLFTPVETVFISLATVIAGTMGDLTESLIKRNFNVKDSGNMLPGHGGFSTGSIACFSLLRYTM